MWANMHLLFWLSLVPFATGWMGINKFDKIPVAAYGVLLLICGASFNILAIAIEKTYKNHTPITEALAKSKPKMILSTIIYAASVPAALFLSPILSALLFASVSIMWIIPSKAIEKALSEKEE
jgi:uncharacterized membrane protein